jgi:hypothetical protein
MKNEFSKIRHKPCMGRPSPRPIYSSTQSSKNQTFQQKAIKLSKEAAHHLPGSAIPENLPLRVPGYIAKPKWKNYRTQNEEIANRLLEKYRADQNINKPSIIGEIYRSQETIKKSHVTTEGLSPKKFYSPRFGDLYKGDPFGLDPRNCMAKGGHEGQCGYPTKMIGEEIGKETAMVVYLNSGPLAPYRNCEEPHQSQIQTGQVTDRPAPKLRDSMSGLVGCQSSRLARSDRNSKDLFLTASLQGRAQRGAQKGGFVGPKLGARGLPGVSKDSADRNYHTFGTHDVTYAIIKMRENSITKAAKKTLQR